MSKQQRPTSHHNDTVRSETEIWEGAILGRIFELFGFGAPLLYALTVFGAFHYMDKRASARAKSAISQWLRSPEYDKEQVASAMVEAFDRL